MIMGTSEYQGCLGKEGSGALQEMAVRRQDGTGRGQRRWYLLFVLRRRIAGPFFLANVVLMWPSGAVFGSETGMAEGIRGLFRVPFETGRPGIPSLFCVFTGFLLVHVYIQESICLHTRVAELFSQSEEP